MSNLISEGQITFASSPIPIVLSYLIYQNIQCWWDFPSQTVEMCPILFQNMPKIHVDEIGPMIIANLLNYRKY